MASYFCFMRFIFLVDDLPGNTVYVCSGESKLAGNSITLKKLIVENLKEMGANCFYINILGANASEKGAFLCLGHLVLEAFANGGNFICSCGNFMNIRVNQSKIVGKLKRFWGQF